MLDAHLPFFIEVIAAASGDILHRLPSMEADPILIISGFVIDLSPDEILVFDARNGRSSRRLRSDRDDFKFWSGEMEMVSMTPSNLFAFGSYPSGNIIHDYEREEMVSFRPLPWMVQILFRNRPFDSISYIEREPPPIRALQLRR